MSQQKNTILLITDDTRVKNIYFDLLNPNGFKVVETKSNPIQAGQFCNLAKISETEFNLLVWVNFKPTLNFKDVVIGAFNCQQHHLPFIFINHAFLDSTQKTYIKYVKKFSYFYSVPCYYPLNWKLEIIKRISRK